MIESIIRPRPLQGERELDRLKRKRGWKTRRYTKRVPKSKIMGGKNHVRCHYCGKRLNAAMVTRDHVRAHSNGGYGRMKNLVPCCAPCNSAKGSMSKGEFMQKRARL